ncbi:hypothetical protein [Halobacteriovorax sp. YZS-1-1]|uniref:hypothetical protein n=1 Tax=unclassified Halobacteriovorax TaxID=2639665 RepID=UPI00399B5817
MKKLFLVSILSLLTSYVLSAPRETPTETFDDSICLTRGLDLKQKMKEIDELIAKSAGSVIESDNSSATSQ